MKSPLFLSFITATLLTSCLGNSSPRRESNKPVSPIPEIVGHWDIINVVCNDSLYVRPSDVEPETVQYIDFHCDGTFGISTNCNMIGGKYVFNSDSVSFSSIYITEMACDNMDVEQLLMNLLPRLTTIDVTNDSTIRLNAVSSAYIVLKKPSSERPVF